jgi:aryl-alcohol dehydrogenase-like predicted oxidoreductase
MTDDQDSERAGPAGPDRPGLPVMPMAPLGAHGPAVSRIGLGLAALGRPAYITGGRSVDLPDRSVAGMRARTIAVLDAAYAAGVRYVDAARSYGRAEEFLGGWLADRDHPDVVVGSKWGYAYTGGWRLDASVQEVKEHSLAMFTRQLAQTRGYLGSRLALYQVHSLTEDSGLLDDPELLAALAGLRRDGVIVGLSTSGPRQAATLRRALATSVDGEPLFSAAEVTWNLLERSVASAAAEAAHAGWAVLVKEAVANGRLAPGDDSAGPASPLASRAAAEGVTADAVAIAAALAQPWATVVLSGAVTTGQLRSNLAALRLTAKSDLDPADLGRTDLDRSDLDLADLDLAEPPDVYWAERAARPWT